MQDEGDDNTLNHERVKHKIDALGAGCLGNT